MTRQRNKQYPPARPRPDWRDLTGRAQRHHHSANEAGPLTGCTAQPFCLLAYSNISHVTSIAFAKLRRTHNIFKTRHASGGCSGFASLFSVLKAFDLLAQPSQPAFNGQTASSLSSSAPPLDRLPTRTKPSRLALCNTPSRTAIHYSCCLSRAEHITNRNRFWLPCRSCGGPATPRFCDSNLRPCCAFWN